MIKELESPKSNQYSRIPYRCQKYVERLNEAVYNLELIFGELQKHEEELNRARREALEAELLLINYALYDNPQQKEPNKDVSQTIINAVHKAMCVRFELSEITGMWNLSLDEDSSKVKVSEKCLDTGYGL